MRFSYSHLVLCLFSISYHAQTTQANQADAATKDNSVFMWSSTGGGWRAMVACMGFANLFGKSNLLPMPAAGGGAEVAKATTTTQGNHQYFDAISTTSGASWFSTQLFFSSNFYKETLQRDPSNLVRKWMVAYKDIGKAVEEANWSCDLPSDLPSEDDSEFGKLLQICTVMMHYNAQWAAFIEAMLHHSATKAYDDTAYSKTLATPGNRIAPLKDQNIKLLLHTTLVAQTRTFKEGWLMDSDYVSSLGPAADSTKKYAGVIPVTYSVDSQYNATNGVFNVGGGGADSPLVVHQEETDRLFHEDGWNKYGLYPLKKQNTYLIPTDKDSKVLGSLDTNFFAVKPTTSQVASISSAAAGGLSPSAPSTFAQLVSYEKAQYKESWIDDVGIDIAIQGLYDSDIARGVAVCTQWPKSPCGDLDGRFIDGAYTDNPAFIQNIAHYQQTSADLSKTLKIVLTDTNQKANTKEGRAENDLEFVKYWKNDKNADVAPGTGYLWGEYVPYGSPQIFAEELTIKEYGNDSVHIPNSNVTTRLLKGTTIENPLFRTKAGQKVEILLITLNSPIPIMIVGSSEAEEYTQPLVDMAHNLATNSVLLKRVQAFFSTTNSSSPDSDGSPVAAAASLAPAEEPPSNSSQAMGASLEDASVVGDSGNSSASLSWGAKLLNFGASLLEGIKGPPSNNSTASGDSADDGAPGSSDIEELIEDPSLVFEEKGLPTGGAGLSYSQTCEDVLDNDAGGHTCGNRVKSVMKRHGKSQNAAKRQIGHEFPDQCGPCSGVEGA